MSLRAAVIGCGFIGAGEGTAGLGAQSHAAAWTAIAGVDLVALADSDPERLGRAQARWGVADGFPTAGALLAAARPDVVSLCTPDPSHGPLLAAILDTPSVRAVLAEKPLALDLDEAGHLVRRARDRGVRLAVNYGRRSLPSHRALRRWIAGGGLGTVQSVTGRYVRGLKHNGTHWLDLARFLVGEIRSVRPRPGEPVDGPDPTIDVMLEFEGGARGLLTGLRGVDYALFEMDLVGTRGRARILEGGHRFEIFAAGASPRFPGFRELLPVEGPAGGIDDLVRHPAADLIAALAEGREPACTGDDAVAALALATSAIESLEGQHASIGL